jgi:hypothetical protein
VGETRTGPGLPQVYRWQVGWNSAPMPKNTVTKFVKFSFIHVVHPPGADHELEPAVFVSRVVKRR